MSFKEKIQSITKEQVDDWWFNIAPKIAPASALKDSYKYFLKKEDKELPFKWSVAELCKYYNIEPPSFTSNYETRFLVQELFGFQIIEKLNAVGKDKEVFIKNYKRLVMNPKSFQQFIKVVNDILYNVEIDPYKVRFAISKDEFVMLIGMRIVFSYNKDNKQTSEVSFLSNEDNLIAPYSPIKRDYGEFKLYTLEEIANDELADYIDDYTLLAIQKEYNKVSKTKSAQWNDEASTTSDTFKYIVYNNINVEEWIEKGAPDLRQNSTIKIKNATTMSANKNPMPLNQILYGPPGTGKTYATIQKAVAIANPSFTFQNRVELKEEYKRLIDAKRIAFTTFHQSMSYEDFVEGIKPVMDEENNELQYKIEDGIFKEMASLSADSITIEEVSKSDLYIPETYFKSNLNKLSLGNTLRSEDDNIYEYCVKNNCVAIGFGDGIDFSGIQNKTDIRKKFVENGYDFKEISKFKISAMERFILWMEKEQLIFISKGNKVLQAIAVVKGDYYYEPDAPIHFSHFRKVEWLYTDLNIPIREIYPSSFSQQSIYQMDPKMVDQSFFSKKGKKEKNIQNHVLIIDEINRGNVSSIFGELITLLEPDKRAGAAEELEVILPYSKESFKVPNNLYIIGTMNTADRSVEALDTALRRRFEFQEMMPKYDLEAVGSVEGIALNHVLRTINQRVELLLDRDHSIGHSYFIGVETKEALATAFSNKIIPLLQEYFYGDYGKIGLVLGKGFVEKVESKSNVNFAPFDYPSQQEYHTTQYNLTPLTESNILEAVRTLLNLPEQASN